MSDQLENFIRDNRHQFDDQEPTNKVWKGIYRNLNTEDKPRWSWMWKAAAILFFLTSSVLFYQLKFGKTQPLIATNGMEQLNSDFKSVESFYFEKISEKKELIYDFEEDNIRVDGDFEQDLQKLDAMYAVLKDELKNNPSKKVVDALILNLLVRVDILNSELQKLEEYASGNKEKKEINV